MRTTFTILATLAVALFAGATLGPASANPSIPAMSTGPALPSSLSIGAAAQFRNGQLPKKLTREQIADLRPMAVPERVHQRALRYFLAHRQAFSHRAASHAAKKVTSFLTDYDGYIWELGAKGQVLGDLTDCSGAQGAKVDSYGNLWVACTLTNTINMYAPGASSASLTLNDTVNGVGYYPVDVATDGVGNVYATNIEGLSCISSSCNLVAGNVLVFASNQAGGFLAPAVVNDPNIASGYFLDTDGIGNVYVDYAGSGSCSGYGLDQIISPQANYPTVNSIVSPCASSIEFPGGVYTSNFDSQLNVLDQLSQVITQYPIFAEAVGSPIGYLGPVSGSDPVSVGWNQADSQIAAADAGDAAVDFGTAPQNVWKQDFNGNFLSPIGAAYVASDKFQPQYVGQYHELIMEALIDNESTIASMVGPSYTGQTILEAMLQVPSIPQGTKDIISEILQVPAVSPNPACQSAYSQFIAGLPARPTVPALLKYLNKELSIQTPCVSFHAATEGAIAIVEDGKSTIYNQKWVNSHENAGSLRSRNAGQQARALKGKPATCNWCGWVAVADCSGAEEGEFGGIWGMLAGAAIESGVSYLEHRGE
jgi:hypothetical protein